jgi:hypothetical protein
MAGNAIIGALRVVLGADTAQLDKGLKDAQGSLSRFGSMVKTAGVAAVGALAGALGGVGYAIKGVIDEADNLGKLAQSIGIPVEELSKLKHVADLSGVGLEDLGKSVIKLSRSMSEVAGGNVTGAAAMAFSSLGISVRDAAGRMKSSDSVMGEVADKFADMKDGANKTALAVALFGRAGASMIPMLNQGSAAINEAKREAEDLGLVIDKKTSAAAEIFNDNLTRLARVMSGVWVQVSGQLAPELARLSTIFVNLAKDGGLAKSAAEFISGAMTFLSQEVAKVILTVQRLATEFVAFKEIFNFGSDKSIGERFEAFKKAGEETQRQFAQLKATFENDPIGNVDDALAALGSTLKDKVNKPLADAPALATSAKNALQSFLESQAKSTAAREAEVKAVGLETGAKERLKVVDQASLIAAQNRIALTPQMNAAIAATADAAAQAALKLEGMNLIQQSLAPHEVYRLELEKNRLALAAVGATAEQVGRVQQAAAEKAGTDWGTAGASIAGSMQKIGDAFSKESKSMAAVAKVAGVIQATISMFTGAAKALELPFPANLAAMATVLAQGAGLVASIKSQKVSGFATGGSFRVPGGMGGGDKVHAAFEPGEIVDVWRPGEGDRDQRGGGGRTMTEVTVNMAGEVFNRDTLRKLIDGLNDMGTDGYRLKIA